MRQYFVFLVRLTVGLFFHLLFHLTNIYLKTQMYYLKTQMYYLKFKTQLWFLTFICVCE